MTAWLAGPPCEDQPRTAGSHLSAGCFQRAQSGVA